MHVMWKKSFISVSRIFDCWIECSSEIDTVEIQKPPSKQKQQKNVRHFVTNTLVIDLLQCICNSLHMNVPETK